MGRCTSRSSQARARANEAIFVEAATETPRDLFETSSFSDENHGFEVRGDLGTATVGVAWPGEAINSISYTK